MMTSDGERTMVEGLLEKVCIWAQKKSSVLGVALVGSHSRGQAKPDSDVDFIILVGDVDEFLDNQNWLDEFGVVEQRVVEYWGKVTSIRSWYRDGPQVEFGFAVVEWAEVDPVDQGTRQVVEDGLRILWDPHQRLDRLQQQVLRSSKESARA